MNLSLDPSRVRRKAGSDYEKENELYQPAA
jgi:hypothetical protein